MTTHPQVGPYGPPRAVWPAGLTHLDGLQDRAERLWPDSDYNRAEWLRAVSVVRETVGGWHADIKK